MSKGLIEQLGKEAQKKAIKLSIEGLTYSTIADELSKEYNTEISGSNVQEFLKRKKNQTMQILKDDKKFQGKMMDQYFNTIQQLGNLNSELWKFFYELRKNPERKYKIAYCDCGKKVSIELENYSTLLKTAAEILKQIEHVDKILGRLKQKSFNISYNYVDLSKKISLIIPKLLNDMEKRGIVKINKKRLKLYAGGAKMSNPYESEDEDSDDDDEDDSIAEEL